jgi:bacterioferritin (cytochrome b1)
MSSAVDMGPNRTGIETSPIDSRAMSEEAARMHSTPEPDGMRIDQVREEYAATADPVGTMAPPVTLKGLVKVAAQVAQGKNPAVLLDKLAERLAFERSGTRLYEALLVKLEAKGTWPGGPSRPDLLQYMEEELAHFQLLSRSVTSLGGDPTLQSPSADMTGVESAGIVQVLTDPRTGVAECLHAMLSAELVDNEGWSMLIELTSDFGYAQLADDFRHALREEESHLSHMRKWLSDWVLREAHRDLPRETSP